MRLLLCALAVVGMVAVTGCVMPQGPVFGGITVDQKGPVSMGDFNVKSLKEGRSKAAGVILVSWGDASISAAMKEAGITRVHHVDCEALNVLGIYARYETIVYGD